ncbi:TIGR02569 family protein [Phycicoccus ginsengisoli]
MTGHTGGISGTGGEGSGGGSRAEERGGGSRVEGSVATAVAVPDRVLDLFAVPGDVRPVPGGQGRSLVAGDLVLSPGRDAQTAGWLNPVLAPLAVRLDLERVSGRAAVRVAMPIPARDGSWVVDGWGASRYEPDTSACHDPALLAATGRLLHARLDESVRIRPTQLDTRTDRWAVADRLAWGPAGELDAAARRTGSPLVRWLAAERDTVDLGPDQLVHGDLAGNVLLDASGTPVVIDLAPYWRPARWAEALCLLDAVAWHGADESLLEPWSSGPARQALVRAALFRLLADGSDEAASGVGAGRRASTAEQAYGRVLGALLS